MIVCLVMLNGLYLLFFSLALFFHSLFTPPPLHHILVYFGVIFMKLSDPSHFLIYARSTSPLTPTPFPSFFILFSSSTTTYLAYFHLSNIISVGTYIQLYFVIYFLIKYLVFDKQRNVGTLHPWTTSWNGRLAWAYP